MDWLNYHHLLYFWHVAREGSVTRASEVLGVTQPTVSSQVASLERHFGQPLFRRTGRSVTLTDAGQLVFDYAEDIFRIGNELNRVMKGGPTHPRTSRVVVGVADVLPKLIVFKLLESIVRPPDPAQLVIIEDKTDRLLAELALHNLDLVLTDSHVSQGVKIKAFHHPLGACGVTLMAAPELAKRLGKNFPASLDGQPFVLPAENTSLRRSLEQWFAARRVRPVVAVECADSALLKTIGQAGIGAFAVPTAVAEDVRKQYGCVAFGSCDGLTERFFAVTVERRLRHPAVLRISQAAREELFPAGVE